MRPQKGTKAYRQETVAVFYGIDPKTLTVQPVWLSRDRMLTTFVGEQLVSHFVMGARSPSAEIVAAWGLTDILELTPATDARYSPRVKKLEAKAAAMRAVPLPADG
jgi:hypothetical protein